jgi:hypothetical protein
LKYYFFLDETGDHSLSFIDENFPIFLLCGCLISEVELIALEKELNKLKINFFKSTEVILHSREIRKCEGSFQVLFDLAIKEKFYAYLNKIMRKFDYTIIGAGIEKSEYIKRYGKGAKDPYAISMAFILERLIFCLDGFSKISKVAIKVEKRGKKEDQMLISDYNSIIDSGTYYINNERFASKIDEFKFHSKRENIIGLQLSDLCAYPLARSIINPAEPYIPFEVIKGKIYCDKEGRFDGWGLKYFP